MGTSQSTSQGQQISAAQAMQADRQAFEFFLAKSQQRHERKLLQMSLDAQQGAGEPSYLRMLSQYPSTLPSGPPPGVSSNMYEIYRQQAAEGLR